jgi:cation diffusion facilitator family transporter
LQKDEGVRIITICFIGNIILLLLKGTVGFWADSEALKADAFNSAGDVINTVVVLLGLRYALKPKDESHHYGHGKMEALVSFLVGVVVAAATGYIVYEAVTALIAGEAGQPSIFALGAALVAIAVKAVMFKITYSAGKRLNSIAVITNAMDHRNDLFATSGAALAIGLAFIGQLADIKALTVYSESVVAILISGVIIKTAVSIITEASRMLLDAAPDDETMQTMQRLAASAPGVEALSWVKSRRMGRGLLVDAAIEVSGRISVSEGHSIADAVRDAIRSVYPEVIDVVVHVNPSKKLKAGGSGEISDT